MLHRPCQLALFFTAGGVPERGLHSVLGQVCCNFTLQSIIDDSVAQYYSDAGRLLESTGRMSPQRLILAIKCGIATNMCRLILKLLADALIRVRKRAAEPRRNEVG